MEQNNQTVKEWLSKLSLTNTSTEQDSKDMLALLRNLGFNSAVVVSGIVYLEGQGTIDAPPTSIHTVADMILRLAEAGNG